MIATQTMATIFSGTELRPRQVHHIAEPHSMNEGFMEAIRQDLLLADNTSRKLPSALMYDSIGLSIWSKLVKLPDYYIPKAEIDALEQWGDAIVLEIGEGKALIDLGSGDISKVIGLLSLFEKRECPVYYFALDLDAKKLQKSMDNIPQSWQHVKPFAICGNFDHGRVWSQQLTIPKVFLSFGATVANDLPILMSQELAQWASAMGPRDKMLMGLDANKAEDQVLAAYNDNQNLWYEFIRNGFQHSNQIMGIDWYRPEDWMISGTIGYNPFRHQFVAKALRPIYCESLGLSIPIGGFVTTLPSYKYQPHEMVEQFRVAGLDVTAMWKAQKAPVYQYLLAKSTA